MRDLYSAEGWVTTHYDPERKTIIVRWLNYNSKEHVIKSLEAQIRAMEELGVDAVIVDSGEAIGVPHPETYQWFQTTLYPACIRLRLKLVLNILPENPIARIAAYNWQQLGDKFNLRFIEMPNLQEAIAYIDSTEL